MHQSINRIDWSTGASANDVTRPKWLKEAVAPPAFTVAVAACDRASLWQEVRVACDWVEVLKLKIWKP